MQRGPRVLDPFRLGAALVRCKGLPRVRLFSGCHAGRAKSGFSVTLNCITQICVTVPLKGVVVFGLAPAGAVRQTAPPYAKRERAGLSPPLQSTSRSHLTANGYSGGMSKAMTGIEPTNKTKLGTYGCGALRQSESFLTLKRDHR